MVNPTPLSPAKLENTARPSLASQLIKIFTDKWCGIFFDIVKNVYYWMLSLILEEIAARFPLESWPI
jgi:hypothetical protein